MFGIISIFNEDPEKSPTPKRSAIMIIMAAILLMEKLINPFNRFTLLLSIYAHYSAAI